MVTKEGRKKPKASRLYFQTTNNRMRFTERIALTFIDKIKKNKRIFIKPNIVSSELYPTTTHPDVLRYVLKNIPESCDVTVADAPVPKSLITKGMDSGSVIKDHPLSRVCRQLDYELQNLYDLGFEEIETAEGLKLNVSKVALECDYMISLPVIKSHCLRSIGITGALKNNFGLLAPRDRVLLHSSEKIPIKRMRKIIRKRHDINLAIAELNVIRKPDLFIADMVDTLIGANEFRHGGEQKHVGIMLAGSDPVAIDCVGFRLLKKIDPRLKYENPQDVPSIKYALELGVGTEKFKRIEVKG